MPRVTVLLLLVLAALAVPAAAQAAGPPVVRGSVEQVQVTGATPGASVRLVDRPRPGGRDAGGRGARRRRLPRPCAPARGYRVQAGGTTSAAVRVLSTRSAPPSTAPYDQAIPAKGYGYLTTRDGTQLAINVQLPAAPGPTRRSSSTPATATPTRPGARARSRRSRCSSATPSST